MTRVQFHIALQVGSNATKRNENVNYVHTQNILTALIAVASDRSFPFCVFAVLSLLSNEESSPQVVVLRQALVVQW